MIRIIVVVILIILIFLYNQRHIEGFYSDSAITTQEIAKRTQLLVCAYYNLIHDPSVDYQTDYKYIYVLEWRKKTRALGLPYVYDEIFYVITNYIFDSNKKGIVITYKNILDYTFPFVKEIYRKNELNGLVKMLPARETCVNGNDNVKGYDKVYRNNMNEIVNIGIGLSKFTLTDMSAPAIYNVNKAVIPTFTPFTIVSDRGGNNTGETFP